MNCTTRLPGTLLGERLDSSMTQLFSKYILAGLTATLGHYALLVVLVELGDIAPGTAAACGAMAGGAISYLINYGITFRSKESHWASFPKFGLVVILLAVFQGWSVGRMADLGFPYFFGQIAMTVLCLFLGFVFHSTFSFRYKPS